MKHKNANQFNDIKNKLVESRYQDCGTVEEWMHRINLGPKRATKSVRQSIDAQKIVPETFLQRIEQMLEGAYDYQRKCVQPVEPVAILCHGDYLRNNIAYRYDASGKATDAMMFDFQTLRYASPMVDLNVFMANSVGCDEREQYFSNILDAYHDSLIKQYLDVTKWNSSNVPEYLK